MALRLVAETETAPATAATVAEEEADTATAVEAEEAAAGEVVVITLILPTIGTVEDVGAAGDVAVPAAAGAADLARVIASPPVGPRASIPRLPCSAS